MRLLVFVWILLAVSGAIAAWVAMRPDKRLAAWLGLFAGSFIVFGDSGEKSFVAMASYIFNWGMAAGGAAICAGAIVGLSLALAFKG